MALTHEHEVAPAHIGHGPRPGHTYRLRHSGYRRNHRPLKDHHAAADHSAHQAHARHPANANHGIPTLPSGEPVIHFAPGQEQVQNLATASDINSHFGHKRDEAGVPRPHLKDPSTYSGWCAMSTVKSYNDAGFNIEYDVPQNLPPKFKEQGFKPVDISNGKYTPMAGDLIIIKSVGPDHPLGHAETFDGHQFVSDAKQTGMWPYDPSDHPEDPSKYMVLRNPKLAGEAEKLAMVGDTKSWKAESMVAAHEHAHGHPDGKQHAGKHPAPGHKITLSGPTAPSMTGMG